MPIIVHMVNMGAFSEKTGCWWQATIQKSMTLDHMWTVTCFESVTFLIHKYVLMSLFKTTILSIAATKRDFIHCSFQTPYYVLSAIININIVVLVVPYFPHFCTICMHTFWTCSCRPKYAFHICRWELTYQQSIMHSPCKAIISIYLSELIYIS